MSSTTTSPSRPSTCSNNSSVDPVREESGSSTITSSSRPSTCSNNSLLDLVREEFGSQTWQFPPDVFIRMLSPKTPHNPENPEKNIHIQDYDCDTDKDAFLNACERAKGPFLAGFVGPGSSGWPSSTLSEDEDYYVPMQTLINDTISVCRDALQNTSETLFRNLRLFVSHGTDAMDRASGYTVLSPGLIAEETDEWPELQADKEKRKQERPWWCKPNDKGRQITLVCELRSRWSELISQLATYACCQFVACPSRLFVLSIGFNPQTNEVRFIIFHRSGLTASHALNLTKESGRLYFMKIFMTIMIWKERRDAGFSDSNDNMSYNLGNATWDVCERLHQTSCVEGRATFVNRIRLRVCNPPTDESNVQSGTGNVNMKKRKSEDGDGKSTKLCNLKTDGEASISNDPEEVNEDLQVTSGQKIVPSNLCFPIKVRGTPNHNLKAHQETPDDPSLRERVLKECWPTLDHANIEGESLGSSVNEFGVANFRATYKACYSSGQLQSTSIFLPKVEDAEKYHYPVFDAFSGKLPEPRTRVLIEATSIGKSFLEVKPGKDLATCVAHSMLGWLNVYQHGFLHRDISIGNVLAFENAEERNSFQLTDAFVNSLGGVTTQMLNNKLANLGLSQSKAVLIPDAPSWATKLEQLLETHDIRTNCAAFVIDGDMAKNWKALFDGWGKQKEVSSRERSGTELFMSRNLIDPSLKDYIQSPADDIESFLWVTLYATIKNNDKTVYAEQQSWAAEFDYGRRVNVLLDVQSLKHVLDFVTFQGLFNDWYSVAEDLTGRYKALVGAFSNISAKNGWEDGEEARYWKAAWHGYALEGVYKSLGIIVKHMTN